MFLTLEEMKEHLRIDEADTTQDKAISSAIVAAESAVRTHVDDGEGGNTVFASDNEGKRDQAKMFAMLVAASLYETRESETTATVTNTKAFKFLIDQLKNY